jgi:hypothetical protein
MEEETEIQQSVYDIGHASQPDPLTSVPTAVHMGSRKYKDFAEKPVAYGFISLPTAYGQMLASLILLDSQRTSEKKLWPL